MDLSALSAIAPGYARAETQRLQQGNLEQDLIARKAANQTAADDALALSWLGKAFGMAPPDQPPPVAPGQQSQPAPQAQPPTQQPQTQLPPQPPSPQQMPGQPGPPPPQGQAAPPPDGNIGTSNGTPIAPPNTYMNPAKAGPQPQQGAPQAQPRPPQPALAPARLNPAPGGPSAQGQGGPASSPAAQPGGPVVPGQMSFQDLVARISKANPEAAKRPDVLIRAAEKAQKLLAPDEKVLLQQMKIGLDYDAKIQAVTERDAASIRTAQSAQQKAEIAAAGADERAKLALEKAQLMIDAAKGKQDTQNKAVDRRTLVTAATKVGVPVKADMSDEEIQNATALKTADAAGGAMPDTAKKFYGQALLAGDQALVNSALGMSRNRVGTMSQIIEGAQQIDPSFDGKKAAAAAAQYGGVKAAVTQTAKTGAGVELGSNEIRRLLPYATDAAKKLDLTQFPTVNALKNAAAKGGLDKTKQAAVAQLDQYEQAIKSAYRQVIARGGRSTVFDAKQGDALLNDKLPVSVLLASGDAMMKEAEVNKAAVGETIQNITGQGGGAPAAAAEKPTEENDPLGIR